jgi:hypothetical protein
VPLRFIAFLCIRSFSVLIGICIRPGFVVQKNDRDEDDNVECWSGHVGEDYVTVLSFKGAPAYDVSSGEDKKEARKHLFFSNHCDFS